MPTCRDIITRALRIGRVTRNPTAREVDEGLNDLQGIYDGWVASGMFGRLTDVYASQDYEAQPGERVYSNGHTITRATSVDGSEGARAPRDLQAISVYGTAWQHYIWTGAWTELTGLTLNDEAPLADRDAEGLASLLAITLTEGFRSEGLTPAFVRRGLRFQGGISHKFGSTQDELPGEFF